MRTENLKQDKNNSDAAVLLVYMKPETKYVIDICLKLIFYLQLCVLLFKKKLF